MCVICGETLEFTCICVWYVAWLWSSHVKFQSYATSHTHMSHIKFYVWQCSFECVTRMNAFGEKKGKKCTRHNAHSYAWHCSFIRVTWCVYVFHTTDSFIWLIQMCVMCGVIRRHSNCRYAVSITHCNTLQHTATHCNTLQHTATHCNTLQHIVTLQHTATEEWKQQIWYFNHSLQRTATHCNTLQHTATHCNKLQHILQHTLTEEWEQQTWFLNLSFSKCWLKQVHTYSYLSPRCNTLQHTATHCNTL